MDRKMKRDENIGAEDIVDDGLSFAPGSDGDEWSLLLSEDGEARRRFLKQALLVSGGLVIKISPNITCRSTRTSRQSTFNCWRISTRMPARSAPRAGARLASLARRRRWPTPSIMRQGSASVTCRSLLINCLELEAQMYEIQAVVDAYSSACARGERAAMATVVNVCGSAYRRPGARMLITESGRTTGSISGGCLERDVVERAAEVMRSGRPRIVEYDTRGGEDIVWGLGLGCNGVVHVLLESLHESSDGARAMRFIGECLSARRAGVIAVVTGPEDDGCGTRHLGGRFMLDRDLRFCLQSNPDPELMLFVREGARQVLIDECAMTSSYRSGTRQIEVFFDLIVPPPSLVIFGAGPDAIPLVHLARTLGWHVTVVDPRAREAMRERFREADEVILCRAEDLAGCVSLDLNTSAVMMTHHYLDDMVLLQALLPSPVNYLGLLGPKQGTRELLRDVKSNGLEILPSWLGRLHSPIGLDIGAETAEEIALSIIAEIKAVGAGRGGRFLRDRRSAIHQNDAADLTAMRAPIERSSFERESADLLTCHSS